MDSIDSSHNHCIHKVQVLYSVRMPTKSFKIHGVIGEGSVVICIEVAGSDVHVHGGVQARNRLVEQSLLRTRLQLGQTVALVLDLLEHAVLLVDGRPDVAPVVCRVRLFVFLQVDVNELVLLAVVVGLAPLVRRSRLLFLRLLDEMLVRAPSESNLVTEGLLEHLPLVRLLLLLPKVGHVVLVTLADGTPLRVAHSLLRPERALFLQINFEGGEVGRALKRKECERMGREQASPDREISTYCNCV
jgi:hypothetical protein